MYWKRGRVGWLELRGGRMSSGARPWPSLAFPHSHQPHQATCWEGRTLSLSQQLQQKPHHVICCLQWGRCALEWITGSRTRSAFTARWRILKLAEESVEDEGEKHIYCHQVQGEWCQNHRHSAKEQLMSWKWITWFLLKKLQPLTPPLGFLILYVSQLSQNPNLKIVLTSPPPLAPCSSSVDLSFRMSFASALFFPFSLPPFRFGRSLILAQTVAFSS